MPTTERADTYLVTRKKQSRQPAAPAWTAAIASPILLRSDCLSERDLIEIAARGSQQHLLAICERKVLGEAGASARLSLPAQPEAIMAWHCDVNYTKAFPRIYDDRRDNSRPVSRLEAICRRA